MREIQDYSIPVHRSLLANDMLLGIGTNAAIILLVVTVLAVNMIGLWFLLVSVGIYFVLRILCKEDPYLLEITLNNLLEQDVYYG